MTITTTGNSQTFLGNGATTVFTFTFVGGDLSWLSVVYTNASGTQTDVTSSGTLALSAAVGGALWGVGGTFTYNPSGSPIAAGTTLTITRTIPLTQLTAFANQNSIYNEVTEETFDTTVMQIQQVNANGLGIFAGTSTTSLTIATGTQTLTTDTDLAFAPGMFVTIAYQTTPSNFMQGIVTSYTASTGVLVVFVTAISGSGTFASWYIGLSGGPAQGTVSLTGDVTGSGTTSIATTIANNAVSNAKFRQGAALSVVGVTGNSTANVADIAAASDGQVLRRSGTAVSFGAVSLSTAAAITGTLPVGNGGTGSNLSATGGTSQVLKQTSVGGVVTVAQLAASDLSNGTTGSGAVLLSAGTAAIASGKTLTVSNTLTMTGTDGITIPFGTRTRQVFLSGSGTYSRPTNVKYLNVRMVGGGGGGSGSGGSLATQNGTDGGDTTFSTFTAPKGVAGAITGTGTAPTTPTGGDVNIPGGRGGAPNGTVGQYGGRGGGTPFGSGGETGVPAGSVGLAAAINSGAGGGGATAGAVANNGGGGNGGGYIEVLIIAPSATYSYGVGAKGTGGPAGIGGQAGGDGGLGIIIVDEFYQ